MKKVFVLLCIAALVTFLFPAALAQQAYNLPPEFLANLTHNAPNTGKMLPERFDPYHDTYLLTVASWVSRITFTPTASSDSATITVNGQPVISGQKSQIIQMSNDPQMVSITVSVYNDARQLMAQKTYTVFLQRRPSERRTRVSAGFISSVALKDKKAVITADLVTLNYKGVNNLSTYVNDTVYLYKYATSDNCLFYFGTMNNPIRAVDAKAFMDNYLLYGSNLYYLVYIEDEIVAVFPYASD
ncbi:MAG: cadherin-like beta sandwich domain-containing protein [Bacillota bacterium]|nr:cadherin-like beta sandwich domain-containing protein [Bacillota bacterium]